MQDPTDRETIRDVADEWYQERLAVAGIIGRYWTIAARDGDEALAECLRELDAALGWDLGGAS